MTETTELLREIQDVAPSANIELFELDNTAQGGEIHLFHAGTNDIGQAIVWQGKEYIPYPIEVSGFELTSTGQPPRPRMQVSDVFGDVTALILTYSELRGAKVTRRRTLARFLDAVNFPGGVNPSADPTSSFADDVFFVDRLGEHRPGQFASFELASALDMNDIMLPRRQIIQNTCTWRYRSAECGYTGPPVATKNDTPLTLGQATTPEEVAFFNALTVYNDAVAARKLAATALQTRANELNNANVPSFLSEHFNRTSFPYYYTIRNIMGEAQPYAVWNSTQVTLGAEFRVGRDSGTHNNMGSKFHYIEQWGVNPATVATATANLAAAQTVYSNALANELSKLALMQDAQGDLPPNSPMLQFDQCSRHISGCKLRFGANGELPFGGFPAAGLIR